MTQINYDKIVKQLKLELKTDSAIANRYGIVLASSIKNLNFNKGNVIPQKILELIMNRNEIARELDLNQINSFALEAQDYNYLFTFSEKLILISKVGLNLNLAQFMPSIRVFTQKLSNTFKEQEEVKEFSIFDFSKEISKIESTLNQEDDSKEKYSIIKELIKYISK
ncbi:MAG: hypothetical protein ACFFAN_11395 [Promethearchaeota archaeon]